MNGVRDPRPGELALTEEECRAITSLQRLAKRWPKGLMLFGGGGWNLSVRRCPTDGALYDARWEVASIHGIFNDGGDGGQE
jgi:hypothetical protein